MHKYNLFRLAYFFPFEFWCATLSPPFLLKVREAPLFGPILGPFRSRWVGEGERGRKSSAEGANPLIRWERKGERVEGRAEAKKKKKEEEEESNFLLSPPPPPPPPRLVFSERGKRAFPRSSPTSRDG